MDLYTERLLLRPWKEMDAESLYEYAKDPRVGPIAGWPVHTSVRNSRDIIKNLLSNEENYAICLKKDERPIGCVSLMIGGASSLNLTDKQGEIGFWIGVPFWGNGLVPEAVNEMIRYGFEELNLEKIWCRYFDGNIKSKRVQEKCGFKYKTTIENVYVELMDEIRTEHINVLNNNEWKKVNI